MALIDYIQTGDPGPVGAGKVWKNDDGDLFFRNTKNTHWLPLGVVDERIGMASVSGSVYTGALTGNHGLAPAVSPNFRGTAKLLGVDLVTVESMQSTIEANVAEFAYYVATRSRKQDPYVAAIGGKIAMIANYVTGEETADYVEHTWSEGYYRDAFGNVSDQAAETDTIRVAAHVWSKIPSGYRICMANTAALPTALSFNEAVGGGGYQPDKIYGLYTGGMSSGDDLAIMCLSVSRLGANCAQPRV